MKECKSNIERIALNLTDEQFKGYCAGMSLHWLFKSIDDHNENITARKRVKFWDGVYSRYKHHCE